jgi:PLD-like domain
MRNMLALFLIFPHFVQGGGYQTTFTFNNFSSSPTQITLDLYSQSGALIESDSVPLAGLGSGTYTLTGNTLTVGWARAQFAGTTDIAGTETIQLLNATGNISMEASVFAAQPDTVLHAPVYEKDGRRTGLALANPGTAGSEASIVLRRNDGSTAGSTTVPIGGSQQLARFVSDLFPSLNNFEGTAEISSTTPVAGIALVYNESAAVFSTVPVSPHSAEAFFSPKGGISSLIVEQIQGAQTTIDIAIYEFTRTEIANALIAARNRGVAIRLLADSSEAAASGSAIPHLEAAGIPVKRTIGSGGGIMHDKVAIFDGQVLLTGSYNWSTTAEEENDENALFIRTPSLIAAYQSTFDRLWVTR